MDFRLSVTLTSMILFLIVASPMMYTQLQKMTKLHGNASLAVRAVVFGILTYLAISAM